MPDFRTTKEPLIRHNWNENIETRYMVPRSNGTGQPEIEQGSYRSELPRKGVLKRAAEFYPTLDQANRT